MCTKSWYHKFNYSKHQEFFFFTTVVEAFILRWNELSIQFDMFNQVWIK